MEIDILDFTEKRGKHGMIAQLTSLSLSFFFASLCPKDELLQEGCVCVSKLMFSTRSAAVPVFEKNMFLRLLQFVTHVHLLLRPSPI
jgi:hypothetical protein